MRVLAAQLTARVPGGTGRYTGALIRSLMVQAEGGRRVEAVGVWHDVRPLLPREIAVSTVRVPVQVTARLWERGLPPYLASDGVIHAPTLLVPPKRSSQRLVVTVHDVVPWTHPETLTPRGVRFHHLMAARAAREADLIVTPTEAVARQLREVLGASVRIEAVLSGVVLNDPPRDAARRRAALGVSGDYCLFVGTAEPRKGLDVLAEAMSRPAVTHLGLVVVGPPGWGQVQVPDLAARAGISSRVVVTGTVGEADLSALYAGARVLAMPSRAEGFGFPVVEAMGYGVPVVVSDDAALVEVAGGAALTAPVGDADALALALAAAAVPGPEREALVSAGRRRARDFRWDEVGRRMWRLYGAL